MCACHKKCCKTDMIEKLLKNNSPIATAYNSMQPNLLRNIEKRIVHGSLQGIPSGCQSHGGGFQYPKESKFHFHYQIRKVDNDRTVLDDTRKYGKAMELYSGKEFQLDFWEHCLGTMLPGEVASFIVPPERLTSFAVVNRRLRDYMLNKKDVSSGRCCGLMNSTENAGLGYLDLDEFLIKPEKLEFIFDLFKVDVAGEVRKDTWIMSSDEKADLLPTLRQEGNDLFNKGDYSGASLKYKEALDILEQLCLREKPGDKEWNDVDKLRIPFYLNLAQAQFKMKDFYEVIRNTSEVISRDPENIKALYRRSKAYTETWDLNLAIEDLKKIEKLSEEWSVRAKAEIEHLIKKQNDQELNDRRRLATNLSNFFPSSTD